MGKKVVLKLVEKPEFPFQIKFQLKLKLTFHFGI